MSRLSARNSGMKKGYKFDRDENCPYCGIQLARNWYVRHIREKHPNECEPLWGHCSHCNEPMNDLHAPPHRMVLEAIGKRYKLCDDCYATALRRMSAFWDWLWAEDLDEYEKEN